jgi:hypothetical protein
MKGTNMKFFCVLSAATLFYSFSSLACDSGACPQCFQDICVGQNVINVSNNNRTASVIGIATNDTFVLNYDDGSGIGSGWSRADLAVESGCSNDLCVGQKVVNISNENRTGNIAGIEYDGLIVMSYDDGSGLGSGWSRSDLVCEN